MALFAIPALTGLTFWGKLAAIGAAIVSFFVSLLGSVIAFAVGFGMAKIVAILGIGTISYQGYTYTFEWVGSQILNVLSTLPPNVLELLTVAATLLHLNQIFSVLFSAVSTVLAMWTFKGVYTLFNN